MRTSKKSLISKNSTGSTKSVSRENRIKEYLDMLDLGNELYESDKRIVTRKTVRTTMSSISKEILTEVETETVEFS